MARFVLAVFASMLATSLGLAATSAGDPEKDPQMDKLLWDARHLVDGKDAAGAIAKCDTVIKAYKAYYGGRKERSIVRARAWGRWRCW